MDHYFYKGVLTLKVNYLTIDDQQTTLEIPFGILRKDVPLELAKYIQENVVDEKRGGYYNTWSKNTIKAHGRCIRRLYRSYNVEIIDKPPSVCKKKNSLSVNQ